MFPSLIVFELTSKKILTIQPSKDTLNLIVKDPKTKQMLTGSIDLGLARQSEEGEAGIAKNTILEMLEKMQPLEISNSMDALKISVWIYGFLKSKLI